MQSPDNPERWALVCKAKPNGSVKGTPTAENNTGRWDYDESNRHYDFILGDRAYAQNGSNYNYSIRSQKVSNTNMCLNYAGPGQTYSINLWSDPADGNGGIWEFRPVATASIGTEYPAEGTVYRISNNTGQFKGMSLYDNGNSHVRVADDTYGANLWELVETAVTDGGQTFKLRNTVTGRYISSTAIPVALGESGAVLTNAYNTKSGDFSIMAGNDALFPMPERSTTDPGTLNKGGIYPQGTGWIYEKASLATYECYDKEGNLMQKFYQAIPDGKEFVAQLPDIPNHEAISYETTADGDNRTVKATYGRTSYSITFRCSTTDGNVIAEHVTPCAVGGSCMVEYPSIEFFTCIGSDIGEGTAITPEEDTVIDVYYDCEGTMGAAEIGQRVTELKDGASYLIYNAKDETSRSGFLSAGKVGEGITTTNGINEANPGFIWNLSGSEGKYTVMNNYGIYIPRLLRGSLVTGSDTPEQFIFTLNSDGTTWSVQGTSNSYYWNGNANNTFTGWDGGHPFIIYSYRPHPYFTVQYKCVDENGTELASGSRYVKGGEPYTLFTPIIEGYTLKENDADYDRLAHIDGNIVITLTYTNGETSIAEIKEQRTKSKEVYDLTGRKVKNPNRGIYIIDGKKTLVR